MKIAYNDNALIEAVRLKCENCYGALSFANALGGSQTDAWKICHQFSLADILVEAEERKLDISNLECKIEKQKVVDSMYYKRAKGIVTEAEFQQLFRKWKNG